ncbi:uncharacterized protein Z518_02080 [Rhinocladiella mackenziei CBS 650.93]|uniref:Rhinocladiella mackenziei CBS 650.93 unplaced genomic scaffold supercont1.2, whole genome shotgun sequence n=1 Tax=Rhinocladiella mackenziei CBS 650.93 TaxID=1442369 RepID=A0A0D2FYQ8_9EURO|nr:uncharacterized protein Z518_02080 [Rhinocladiella mackenziei CBS 650.93]KIX07427.1 hypothetical protein Z518_02080 [Rhinocladiella mackenziei CBS 650.93]
MSTLIAYHAEWALLTPEAGTRAPSLGTNSGLHLRADTRLPSVFPPPMLMHTRPSPYRILLRHVDSADLWRKNPEILQAWEELKVKHGLTCSPFDEKALCTFGLIDGEVLGGWSRVISTDQNRKLGWHGFVDTKSGAVKQVIMEMADLRMALPLA